MDVYEEFEIAKSILKKMCKDLNALLSKEVQTYVDKSDEISYHLYTDDDIVLTEKEYSVLHDIMY